jgi:hypothetical protein
MVHPVTSSVLDDEQRVTRSDRWDDRDLRGAGGVDAGNMKFGDFNDVEPA